MSFFERILFLYGEYARDIADRTAIVSLVFLMCVIFFLILVMLQWDVSRNDLEISVRLKRLRTPAVAALLLGFSPLALSTLAKSVLIHLSTDFRAGYVLSDEIERRQFIKSPVPSTMVNECWGPALHQIINKSEWTDSDRQEFRESFLRCETPRK